MLHASSNDPSCYHRHEVTHGVHTFRPDIVPGGGRKGELEVWKEGRMRKEGEGVKEGGRKKGSTRNAEEGGGEERKIKFSSSCEELVCTCVRVCTRV